MGLFDRFLSSENAQANTSLIALGDQTTRKEFNYSTYEQDARQYISTSSTSNVETRTDARVYAPTTIYTINSSGANVSSKKEASSSPAQSITPTVSPQITPSQSLTASPTIDRTETTEKGGNSLIGGSAGTLFILGAVGVGGFILYRRFT